MPQEAKPSADSEPAAIATTGHSVDQEAKPSADSEPIASATTGHSADEVAEGWCRGDWVRVRWGQRMYIAQLLDKSGSVPGGVAVSLFDPLLGHGPAVIMPADILGSAEGHRLLPEAKRQLGFPREQP